MYEVSAVLLKKRKNS